jgi:hypothetical protein
MSNLIQLVHSPTEAEVEWAKVSSEASILMNTDSRKNFAKENGRSLFNYGCRMTPDAVTSSDVQATAYKFFSDQDHALQASTKSPIIATDGSVKLHRAQGTFAWVLADQDGTLWLRCRGPVSGTPIVFREGARVKNRVTLY